MNVGPVRARRGRTWRVASWLAPVLVAALVVAVVVAGVTEESAAAIVVAAPLLAFLAYLVSEATEQVELREDSIIVSRPPMPSIRIAARDITAIEKFTPSQWFVRSRGQRRPLAITFKWLDNDADVQAALIDLADRYDVAIAETDMYKDTST